MNQVKFKFLAIFLTALVASCGGGGGGSAVPPTLGYVVDAPVQGLAYTCGALTGTTGSDGSFLHDAGSACTFKIGNITIGSFNAAPGDGIVTPHDLAGVSRGDSLNTSAVAIAQFLQSLDDGSGSGKIKIPDSVVTALSTVPAQKIVDGATTLSQSTLTNLVSTATNNTKSLVSAATAGAAMNTYIQTTYPALDVNKGSASSTSSSSSSSSTTNPVVSAPKLTAPPPSSLTAVLNSVGLTATTDIAAIGYYVVLPSSASMPNKWQIVAGTDGSNKAVTLSGSFNMNSGAAATQTITGLSFSTEYKVYFVAANASQTSKLTDIFTSTLSTGAEPKAPVISSTFPTSLTPISNATSFSVTADVSGTGYWVVLPSNATTPTATQIIGAKDSGGNSVALNGNAAFVGGTSKTFAITGLAYQTAYKLYFVGVNAIDPTKVTAVNSIEVKPEGSVPVITSTFPTTLTPASNATSFSVTTDVSGTGYWVVLPSSEAAPTAAQIIAGQNSAGNSASLNGNAAFVGGTSKTFAITGLAYQTAYKLYFVGVNAIDATKVSSSFSANISIEYKNPEYTIFSLSNNYTGQVSETTYSLFAQVRTDVDSYMYWVLLPAGSTAPSVENIKSGKNASGSVVTTAGNTEIQGSAQSQTITISQSTPVAWYGNYSLFTVLQNKFDASKITQINRGASRN